MTDPERWTDAAVDRHVSAAHRNLVADIAASLDLDAGLREATIPTHHAKLVADLQTVLDIDAGLNAALRAWRDTVVRRLLFVRCWL